MYDRCDAHLSLMLHSLDSCSSLHLSGSPGVCPRYESKEETATTLESNLSSYSYIYTSTDSKFAAGLRTSKAVQLLVQ